MLELKGLSKIFLYRILQLANEKIEAQKNSESSKLSQSELKLETGRPNTSARAHPHYAALSPD